MVAKSVQVSLAVLVVFAVQAAYICGPLASEKQTSDHLVSVVLCSVFFSVVHNTVLVILCKTMSKFFFKCPHKSMLYKHHKWPTRDPCSEPFYKLSEQETPYSP